MIKQKGLGRGLNVLLGDDLPSPSTIVDRSQMTLPLSALSPGRYQPRTRMDETALQELAASITRHGLMQPILVRPMGNGKHEIIAGERRFRAARLAGLEEVPVIIREVPDEQALALALVENIQREDLNALEEAQAVKRLIDEFQYSHEQAALAIGRSRSATSNLLRLLNLAEPVQTMLLAGDLDMGHARALLAVDRATQLMFANRIVEKRLSVRDTEKLVANEVAQAGAPGDVPGKKAATAPDRDLLRLQEALADALAAPVQIQANTKGRGKLVISFGSHEQLQGLLDRLGLGERN